MIIEHNGLKIELLGDPHLGKSFIHGVPLHRRGEREAKVRKQFEKSILETKADIHICLGDLFDKPYVSYDTILTAAQTYNRREEKNWLNYFILRGNHDCSRDLTKASAFDLFKHLVKDYVSVLTDPWCGGFTGLNFFPWHPTVPAVDLVRGTDVQPGIAFGHWDVDIDCPNMIPTKELAAKGIHTAYTGHVHQPREFERDGVKVVVVGSMQPYAHGEGWPYVTWTLDELRAFKGDTKDLCIRVALNPGEVLDEEIECLQLSTIRLGEDDSTPTVEFGGFNLETLFDQAFETEGVADEIAAKLKTQYYARLNSV